MQQSISWIKNNEETNSIFGFIIKRLWNEGYRSEKICFRRLLIFITILIYLYYHKIFLQYNVIIYNEKDKTILNINYLFIYIHTNCTVGFHSILKCILLLLLNFIFLKINLNSIVLSLL